MKIALIHDAKFPVLQYGGTERVIWWLAKGLFELDHQVTLVCAPGSECPFAEVVPWDFSHSFNPSLVKADLFHYFHTPEFRPSVPYLVTIEGNAKPQERFWANTVFVSQNHAERHGAKHFVYNGLDPADYRYESSKNGRLLFLAKASWKVKNVRGASYIARKAGRELDIVGGSRWWLPKWDGVHWRGMLGGEVKARYLANASALIFPVLWHEPFGIAVIEALVSGTPVLASPFGSLPELVVPDVGVICHSDAEFIKATDRLEEFSSDRCREWALEKFHYSVMSEKYLGYYKQILDGENLHANDLINNHPVPIECSLN